MARISLFFIVLLFFLCACNSGGGDSKPTSSTRYGVFYDHIVEGLEYSTPTHNGVTNENGSFAYEPGETIQFSIGDIALGEATASGIITPMTLANSPNANNDTVVNIARFLLTLDDDAQATNQITISNAVRQAAIGLNINFAQTPLAFENDTNVLTAVETLTSSTSSGIRPLVSSNDAIAHIDQSMSELLATAEGVYHGSFGEKRWNCTDNKDHSFDVGFGDLTMTQTNANPLTYTATVPFIEHNFDVLNRYEFTVENIVIDYLGNFNAIASEATYSNGVLQNSSSNVAVTGEWHGDTLTVRYQSYRVGVTEQGDIQCDSAITLQVSR